MWTRNKDCFDPSAVLASAAERLDIVEGLVPDKGITWLYGASMSFKTFVAMSIAAAASRGADWVGRKTEYCLVVYVGAEGGLSLHARRAGAELEVGGTGGLCVVTERPQLDTRLGQARLRGILEGVQPGIFTPPGDVEEDAVFSGALSAYSPDTEDGFVDVMSVLVIVDTYSQTSGGDDKANVSAYIKGLRDMIDDASWPLAFIVVDHATKAGGSYMGSVAKLNDVDSQIEVVRAGQSSRATLHHRKVKDGIESEPVTVELSRVVLGDYRDAYGRPLSTLVARDGTKAAKIAEVAEGKAGVILTLLQDEGGRCSDETLRRLFSAHRSNEGIKSESVARAYKRGKENLQDADLIVIEGGDVVEK